VPTHSYILAETVVGGDLPTWLAERRAKGLPYGQIALELRDLGAPVGRVTVMNWCKDQGVAGLVTQRGQAS
jgi:hypothetical protein